MKSILCYGDSNTHGYVPGKGGRYPFDVRWTGHLQIILGTEYRVIEEGCNSRTTIYDDPEGEWLNGLYYILPCLKSHCPIDLIVLMLGTNDLKERFHGSAEQSSLSVEKMIHIMKTFVNERQGWEPEILLVSPPYIKKGIHSCFASFSESSAEESRLFAGYYKAVAERNGCLYFDAGPVAEISDEDCLHLTVKGHQNLGNVLGCFIKENVFSDDFSKNSIENKIKIRPGRYRHFKGNEYEVIGIARHSESEEPMVVYRALYGDGGLWVRPASMWNETVERDGKVFRRFTYVGLE